MRLLVLGVDEDARLLREQAVAAGYELAQRYSARVSHVAYGEGVDPQDGRYAKIRDAGLKLLPIQTCAAQLGLADAPAPAEPRFEAELEAGSEPVVGEPETGEPRAEPEPDPESDEFPEDDVLDEPGGPDPLAYPPLPEEEPAYATGPDPLPLAAAVIGVDPWASAPGGPMLGQTAVDQSALDEAALGRVPLDQAPLDQTVLAQIPLEDGSFGDLDPAAPAPRSLVLSFAWALIPFFSLGLLTPAVFAYAAVRTRSGIYAAATLGYALAVVLAFALSATHPQPGSTGSGSNGLLSFALAVSWLGGTGHALSSRTRVFSR